MAGHRIDDAPQALLFCCSPAGVACGGARGCGYRGAG
ncbi:hypothetical protein MGAST_22130 [Mycobacterium gastri 'Wayne']|nr:hypothetical protein MGAST_22130 [Mycobacterium gastri 'Wayne']